MSAIPQILAIFIIMAIGLFLRKIKLLNENLIEGMTKIVLSLTLPFLMIASALNPETRGGGTEFIIIMVSSLLLHGVFGSIALFFLRKRRDNKMATVFAHTSVFSNCAFMGYPVMGAVFGAQGHIYVTAYTLGFNIALFTLGVAIYGGKKAIGIKALLLSPGLISSVLSAIIYLTGITLPSFIAEVMQMVGNITTPLAMLLIGAGMINFRPRDIISPMTWLASVMRVLIMPLICWGIFLLCGFSENLITALVLIVAMPGAATTVLMASIYRADAEYASRCIVMSTALSILTIPLWLFLVG